MKILRLSRIVSCQEALGAYSCPVVVVMDGPFPCFICSFTVCKFMTLIGMCFSFQHSL